MSRVGQVLGLVLVHDLLVLCLGFGLTRWLHDLACAWS